MEAGYVPKARYALRMLLHPLGLEPRWVSARDAPRVYYGCDPGAARHAGVWLQAHPDADVFFQRSRPLDLRDTAPFEFEGLTVPACFVDGAGCPDIVASAFLWLSGWQERAVQRRDAHGRVLFEDSLAARWDTARHPVVDAYRAWLEAQLRATGTDVQRRRWLGRDWAFCPTHDVDYVRKWRAGILYRECVRHMLLNDLRESFGGRWNRMVHVGRQMVQGDPYRDALEAIPTMELDRGAAATFFVKAGGGHANDVFYRVGSPFMRRWMARMMARGFEVGFHPSYRTLDEPERMYAEKARLERVTGRPTRSIRQHYLRFDPAATPRLHASLGMSIDSTLGFAEREGFRRGTCMPFQLYDLDRDCPLGVWEMPLAFMDSAFFYRRRFEWQEALDATSDMVRACRRYGGVLVGLWHTTLGDEIDCPGWNEHFQRTLDEVLRRDAAVTSLEQALRGWA